MTIAVGWITINQDKLNRGRKDYYSSLYIGADSRYSWPDKSTWDSAQKVFASTVSPEIFGFSAVNATVPKEFLCSLVSLIDRKVFFSKDDFLDAERKRTKVYNFLLDKWMDYPDKNNQFHIMYGTVVDNSFFLYLFNFERNMNTSTDFGNKIMNLRYSDYLCYIGSGKKSFKSCVEKMRLSGNVQFNSENPIGTSRRLHTCLSNFIESSSDNSVGGHLQVVSLRLNSPNAVVYGFEKDTKRYVLGQEFAYGNSNYDDINCINTKKGKPSDVE